MKQLEEQKKAKVCSETIKKTKYLTVKMTLLFMHQNLINGQVYLFEIESTFYVIEIYVFLFKKN